MINVNSILQYIIKQNGKSSIEEIENLISKIDREPIRETQSKRFRYEIWDKKKYINGISPKEIIKNRSYKIDKAFLVYIDNVLVYFQDHQPEIDGYITINKDNANEIAENFITNKIEENVDNIIVEKVINDILSK